MDIKLDLDKEYGIVLEGGGAKGAYQIGAWKALSEAGVKIKGIAGVSVGALNGALICMDDYDKARYIWENISYSKIMDVDDNLLSQVKSGAWKDMNFHELLAAAKKLLKDGGFDITPLKELLEQTVDEEKIRNSDRELYTVTISLSDRKPVVMDVKEADEGEIKDMLLASAYFPVFKPEKLGGKYYTDGGGYNNVPVDVLIDKGYKDIIIMRIYGLGLDTERFLEIPEDVNLYHIAPRQDLGGILEFDKKKSRRNMMLGYLDAKRMLYGLCGRAYYIDAPFSETYYFDKMMSEMELLKYYIKPELNEEEWKAMESYRFFTERLFPQKARELKLGEDWDYKDMYIAVLEDLAKRLRINRYRIYGADDLVYQIHRKVNLLDSALPM